MVQPCGEFLWRENDPAGKRLRRTNVCLKDPQLLRFCLFPEVNVFPLFIGIRNVYAKAAARREKLKIDQTNEAINISVQIRKAAFEALFSQQRNACFLSSLSISARWAFIGKANASASATIQPGPTLPLTQHSIESAASVCSVALLLSSITSQTILETWSGLSLRIRTKG